MANGGLRGKLKEVGEETLHSSAFTAAPNGLLDAEHDKGVNMS